MTQAKVEVRRQEINLAGDWRQINYLQPVYDHQGGNSTRINIGPDRTILDRRQVKTVLKTLAKNFAIDLSAAKKKYGPIVGRRSSTPLPLSLSFVLLPLKMRQPQGKDDGAWGYAVLDKIARCTGNTVIFYDGTRLDTLVSEAVIYSLVKDGELVKKKYFELSYPQGLAGNLAIGEEPAPYFTGGCPGKCLLKIMEQCCRKVN